jgi:hypothetical protein
VKAATGILELWDSSYAYGRFDTHRLADTIAEAGHPWSRLTVRIS